MKKVLVIGSSNIDYVAKVDNFPKIGETIKSNSFDTFIGGKGLNQAIACSLAGGNVTFFTSLGNDANKDVIVNYINKYNIKLVYLTKNCSTGNAMIFVNANNAENMIVVNGGSNMMMSTSDIDDNIKLIDDSDIILLQLEIPIDVMNYVVKIAKDRGKMVLLNPAPYQKLDKNILSDLDYIIPNQTELAMICNNDDTYLCNAKYLYDKYGVKVITTLGKDGSILVGNKIIKIDSIKVKSIDTTGAGDCYCGTFVAYLSLGYSVKDAMKKASLASGLSTTRNGASNSYYSVDEIDKINL